MASWLFQIEDFERSQKNSLCVYGFVSLNARLKHFMKTYYYYICWTVLMINRKTIVK